MSNPSIKKKHVCIILNPFKHHFCIVKLGLIWVYIVFLTSAKNVECRYLLEPARRVGSSSTHNLCLKQKYEKYQSFLSEKFQFLEVKFSLYFNRRVSVMFRIV